MISILQVRFQFNSMVRLWRKKAKSYHQSAIKMNLNKKKMAVAQLLNNLITANRYPWMQEFDQLANLKRQKKSIILFQKNL